MITFDDRDEDREDIQDAEDALAEPGVSITADEVWATLHHDRPASEEEGHHD